MPSSVEPLETIVRFFLSAYVLQLYMDRVYEERERRRVAGAKTSAYLASLRGG